MIDYSIIKGKPLQNGRKPILCTECVHCNDAAVTVIIGKKDIHLCLTHLLKLAGAINNAVTEVTKGLGVQL